MNTLLVATQEGMTVSGMLSDVTAVITKVVDCITANPVLAVFIGMAIVGSGIGLFSRLMHSSGQ